MDELGEAYQDYVSRQLGLSELMAELYLRDVKPEVYHRYYSRRYAEEAATTSLEQLLWEEIEGKNANNNNL